MLGRDKKHHGKSLFKPENLLREARRQKNIPDGGIPRICLLDPDGDMVTFLKRSGKVGLNKFWACYHTKMYEFEYKGLPIGIIGCAVGAPFAVLLAEQMFVSGCELLISITSAGIINPPSANIRYILIDKALRDEGTSYHYLPSKAQAVLNSNLLDRLSVLTDHQVLGLAVGSSWTTDAPYRETADAIDYAKGQGVTAVEMEASALYAFASAKNKKIVCYAHLTNRMAQSGKDFEKGEQGGSLDSLELVYRTIDCLIL